MNVIIDTSASDSCWNLYESHGEICVHCGCCSKDPVVRTKARIDVLQRHIEHFESFDEWSDDLLIRATQKMNIEKDLRSFRRQLRYYQKRLRELENGGKRRFDW